VSRFAKYVVTVIYDETVTTAEELEQDLHSAWDRALDSEGVVPGCSRVTDVTVQAQAKSRAFAQSLFLVSCAVTLLLSVVVTVAGLWLLTGRAHTRQQLDRITGVELQKGK
jgi:hypothetical protein